MKVFRTIFLLALSFTGFCANAQEADNVVIQQAILQALPEKVTPETATADEAAQAALEIAFGRDGVMEAETQAQMEANLRQVMVSLGELTREGTFRNAPRFGHKNPPGRLYTRVLNLASSNLDVASTTYYGTTVQFIIGLTAAMRDGQNFLNDSKSNAITRK